MIYCLDCGNIYGEPQYFNGSIWLNINGNRASANYVNLPSIVVGSQIWNTSNLDVVTYSNGDPIPQVTNSTVWASLTTGAWCWYNNDSTTYEATYGRMYNWYAVNDPRGLAPYGWHVPTDAEWNKMTKYLDATVDTTCICGTGTSIGSQLKYTSGWNVSGNGTNSSGYAGLPGGYRGLNGVFGSVGYGGYWWTSTDFGATVGAWYRTLSNGTSKVYRNDANRLMGFSVRVLRN